MTRSILCGLLALISVGALSVVPIACQSGGVGDPCTPEDEYNTQFPGFKMAQENIESRSFQCATRICLVNHFQGRVSCPYGQSANQVKGCNGTNDKSTCTLPEECVASEIFAPECNACDPTKDDACTPVGCPAGLTCNATKNLCTCGASDSKTINGIPYFCETDPTGIGVLKSYVCHKPGSCQSADAKDATNGSKQCCVPGTDTPVAVSVCGQCSAGSKRDATQAVYCSCRCCPKCCGDPTLGKDEPCEQDKNACGEKCDPNFNFCKCPNGFSCASIRPNVGLGDAQLTGSYCVIEKTEYTSDLCLPITGYSGATAGECGPN